MAKRTYRRVSTRSIAWDMDIQTTRHGYVHAWAVTVNGNRYLGKIKATKHLNADTPWTDKISDHGYTNVDPDYTYVDALHDAINGYIW